MKVKKGRILYLKEGNVENLIKKKDPKKRSEPIKFFFKIDPRPIHDKKFISFCLKEIRIFLDQSGYKLYVPRKKFFPLKNKDFFQIIYFLIKKLDKNFKIDNKPEEDIPKIFKIIGYPIAITKTTLFSTNSLQGSSVLFNCLYWLVELCLYDLKTTFENDLINKILLKKNLFWNRFVKSHSKFLSKEGKTNFFPKIVKLSLGNKINERKNYRDRKIELNRKIKFKNDFFIILLYISIFFKEKIKHFFEDKNSFINLLTIIEINRYGFFNKIENRFKITHRINLNRKEILYLKFESKKSKYLNFLRHFLKIIYNIKRSRFCLAVLLKLMLKGLFNSIDIIFTSKTSTLFTNKNYLDTIYLKLFENINKKNFRLKGKLFFPLKDFKFFSKIQNIYKNKILKILRFFEHLEIFSNLFRQNKFELEIIFQMWKFKNYNIERYKNEKIEKSQENKFIINQNFKKTRSELFYIISKKSFRSFCLKKFIFLNAVKRFLAKVIIYINLFFDFKKRFDKKEKLINLF